VSGCWSTVSSEKYKLMSHRPTYRFPSCTTQHMQCNGCTNVPTLVSLSPVILIDWLLQMYCMCFNCVAEWRAAICISRWCTTWVSVWHCMHCFSSTLPPKTSSARTTLYSSSWPSSRSSSCRSGKVHLVSTFIDDIHIYICVCVCVCVCVCILKCFVTFLSASLYFSKRGAYWDRLCRDVVGWLSRACTVAKRCILGL